VGAPEGWAEGDPSNLPDPPETDTFAVLGNRRRRFAILVLDAAECPVDTGMMADILAAAENGHAYRAHVDGPSDDPESYCLQTVGDESCEAKKRDEFHVLDEVIRDPDLSEVRTKLIDSITQNA